MRPLLAMAAAVLLLTVPAAAHVTVPAADGKLCLTVGSLNEPITTYTMSGLDMTVRLNNNPGGTCASEDRGEPVADFQNLVETAVAVSPSGDERDVGPLRPQRDAPGKYTSAGPYVWTEPGQYMLRLEGEYEGSSFSGDYRIAGEVPSLEAAFHPPLDDATLADLRAELDAMEARLAAVEAHTDEPSEKGSPSAPLLAASLGIIAVALLARRRG